MKSFLTFLLSVISMFITSCGYSQPRVVAGLPEPIDTVSYSVLGPTKNGSIIIRDTIDLGNQLCIIPADITISFKGGYVKNGALEGNNTKLKSCSTCFEKVRILGTWNVPVIKSSLFGDLTYDNALRDVVALASPTVNNRVYIEKGTYQVSANYNDDVCIPIGNYTELILDGDIWLTPNDYRNSNIIRATGNNIMIRGKGTICGDKHTHIGNSGEWGMGIDVEDGHNVLISDLTIKDCWGDCIYVGSKSTDVKIQKCKLNHGRRQGISITSANGVKIKNCIITNVGGTNPEYAIDVEPNKGEEVDNVVIEGVTVDKCRGGFLVYGKANNAKVGKITIKNSSLTNVPKMPISLQKCDTAIVDNIIFEGCNREYPIHRENVTTSKMRRLTIK